MATITFESSIHCMRCTNSGQHSLRLMTSFSNTMGETTESRTVTTSVNVPPRSRVIFYQKRYRFRKSMFFILDAWGREWNVDSWGSFEIKRKECDVAIDSEDFATVQAELDGSKTGTIDVKTVCGTHGVDVTRKREDCTSRCKNKLGEMGV